MKYLKNLFYILKHKFWVAYYCFKNGLIWSGLVHDNSKLLPSEFAPYSDKFFGKTDTKSKRNSTGHYNPLLDESFKNAWHHHASNNKHHWQYWTISGEDGKFACIDMPEKYIKEMLCDWLGASRAQGNNSPTRHTDFYDANITKMYFTENTQKNIEKIITKIKL